VVARLAVEPFLRLEHVTSGSPCMRGAAGHLAVPEVPGCDLTVTGGPVELGGGFVVQLRRRLEPCAAGRFVRWWRAGYGAPRSATM
jgi:hypothetical protein